MCKLHIFYVKKKKKFKIMVSWVVEVLKLDIFTVFTFTMVLHFFQMTRADCGDILLVLF